MELEDFGKNILTFINESVDSFYSEKHSPLVHPLGSF